MEWVVLMGGFIAVILLGYWLASRLDKAIAKGRISPYWDAEEERLAQGARKRDS